MIEPNLFKNPISIAILDFGHVKKRWSERESMTIGFGLTEIIRELNLYELIFIQPEEVFKYEWCIITFTSHYDVISFASITEKIVKGRCKLVAGGAGLNNPELFSDIIDYQIVGRGEDAICGLIYNNDHSEFYRKNDVLTIRQPKRLLTIGEWSECSVGCSIGCKFCQYGNKFRNENNKYQSGANLKEDFITQYDWKKRNGITAIDGTTEDIRKSVGKNITDDQIISKLTEVYELPEKKHKIKIYNIIGFPGETLEHIEHLKSLFVRADRKSHTKLDIWLLMTHFVPMRFTPMYSEKVNEINFRNYIMEKRYVECFFSGQSIKVKIMPHITTPKSSKLNWATQKIHDLTEFKRYIKEVTNETTTL